MLKYFVWFVGLFMVAVALAFFMMGDVGVVSLFVFPYRIDLSLNLCLLLLLVAFVLLYLALRAIMVLIYIPERVRRWREFQREKAIQQSLVETLVHFLSGRYSRSRQSAEQLLTAVKNRKYEKESNAFAKRLQVLAHLMVAENAQIMRMKELREKHLKEAMEVASADALEEFSQALALRAARWSYEDQNPQQVLDWLDKLSGGATRRSVALRLKFKAYRMAANHQEALPVMRLLAKHQFLNPLTVRSLSRELVVELFKTTHDCTQVQRVWASLLDSEKSMPDVALAACDRLLVVGGEAALAREWLLPLWDTMATRGDTLALGQRVRLAKVLERSFAIDAAGDHIDWLRRIEQAQQQMPQDGVLQFLAGVVCLRLKLWGKAKQLLMQAQKRISDHEFQREVWRSLALLAEEENDTEAANFAYRELSKFI